MQQTVHIGKLPSGIEKVDLNGSPFLSLSLAFYFQKTILCNEGKCNWKNLEMFSKNKNLFKLISHRFAFVPYLYVFYINS